MTEQLAPIPSHVPSELVVDFDLWTGTEIAEDPYIGLSKLFSGPDIFFTPRNGGHWVVVRAKDARDMMSDNDNFSVDHNRYGNFHVQSAEAGDIRMIPAQIDAPEHGKFRKLLNPPLSPAAVAKMGDEIRALSRQLIEGVRLRGECEFFGDVAQMFPVAIFLKLANLPFDDRYEMQRIADLITRTPGRWADGMTQMGNYLRQTVMKRREQPGADLLSIIATAKVDGEYIPEKELLQVTINVVMGGLDTVVSGLSFIIRYLARNQDKYREMLANQDGIKHQLEELLRIHGVATTERYAKHDMQFKGLQLKRGDRFAIIPALYGVDPEAVERPLEVDFKRTVSPHLIFGAGIHHCVGSHLARFEMRVFLEEWMHAVPEFGLKPGVAIESTGGFVLQPKQNVYLQWDPAKTRSAN